MNMLTQYARKRLFFLLLGISLFFLSSAFGQLTTARIAVTQGRLDSICGTHNIKLVFMCKNYGYFVDFSEATPQIRQMANVTNSFFPVISSDGKSITYQSGIEAEGPSTSPVPGKVWYRELAVNGTPVKLADTGYVPRFVQNAPVDTPAIIYATSVACPQQICYSTGQTVLRKIVNNNPLPVETLFAGGSYYGGLSWDNRYLITGWPGGPNGFMLDLQNIADGPHAVHSMRVKKTGTNADTVVSVGTCNISRSASRIFTNSMLYYDFGSAAVEAANCFHPVLGSWPAHALLFISRYDSEDLKIFRMPADRKIVPSADAQGLGEAVGKEWYFPEWSNHPYYAAAGLSIDRLWLKSGNWEHTYNTESIYLVGLKDSTYVKLIESTDTSFASATNFIYPWVWVEKPAGFAEDSTWLAKTIWQGTGVRRPFGNPKRSASAQAILSDPLITGISVFNHAGKKIATLSPSAGLTPEKVRRLTGPGKYFLAISRTGKPRAYIRIDDVR
jgi:hypothetical protein